MNIGQIKLENCNQQYFVSKVNEIYHDIEAELYSQRHPEIYVDEVKRWRKIARKYFKNSPISILDIGVGAGFVPLTIAPFLKGKDTIICSDISSEMLKVCQRETSKRKFQCQFKFVKLGRQDNNLTSVVQNPVDFVTINSVLHHIQNIDKFFSQIYAVLSKKGVLIILHEPNRLFFNNWFLWNNYVLLDRIFDFRSLMILILKNLDCILS